MSSNDVVCVACILTVVLSLGGLAVSIFFRSWFGPDCSFHFVVGAVGMIIGVLAALILGGNAAVNTIGFMTGGTVMALGFGMGFLCLGLLLSRLPGDE